MVTLNTFVDNQFNEIMINIDKLIDTNDNNLRELFIIHKDDLIHFYMNKNKEFFNYKLEKLKEMLSTKKLTDDKINLMIDILESYKKINDLWDDKNKDNSPIISKNKVNLNQLFKRNLNYIKLITNSDMKLINLDKINEDFPLNVKMFFHNNVYQNIDIFKKKGKNCLRLYYGNEKDIPKYGNTYYIEETEKFISYVYDKKINYIGYQLVYCDEDREI